MMDLVIDTSVAVATLFPDERYHSMSIAVLKRLRNHSGAVPSLFWSEVRSVLVKAERRGRVSPESSQVYVRQLRRLRLTIDTDQVDSDVLSLASKHGLTGYDAEYLETALRRNARLATFDKRLFSAAKWEGSVLDILEFPELD